MPKHLGTYLAVIAELVQKSLDPPPLLYSSAILQQLRNIRYLGGVTHQSGSILPPPATPCPGRVMPPRTTSPRIRDL